jgi:hypothetical protein
MMGDQSQNEREPSGERTCPRCGIRFKCGAEAGEERCWCAGFPAVAIDAALPGCLCSACLEERAHGIDNM